MKKTLLAIAAAALVLTLPGCSTIKAVGTASSVASTPVNAVDLNKAAFTARATYVGALVVAAQVVKMPRCEKAPAPCVPQAAVDQIRKAELVADAVTQTAEDAARNSGTDPTVLKLLVDNATKGASLFKFAADTYKTEK